MREGRYTYKDLVIKIAVGEDTTRTTHTTKVRFRQNTADTLLGFKIAAFRTDGYTQIYNGVNLFSLLPWDKTLEVTPAKTYPKQIKSFAYQYPFFQKALWSLNLHNNVEGRTIKLVGTEVFQGQLCYKLSLDSELSRKNRTEMFCYVSVRSFLPVRELTTLRSTIGKAEEILIFDYSVSAIQAGPVPESDFTKERLGEYTREKEYNPQDDATAGELLPAGTAAPAWQLPVIGSDSLKLSDLKGKIVVMDFWYKACAPCQKQMIALQKLHDTFPPNDVVFVGINTIDDPVRDKLAAFLKLRNVTMQSVYKGNSIVKQYNVTSSPALFVIDRTGRVVHTISGWTPDVVETIHNVLTNELARN